MSIRKLPDLFQSWLGGLAVLLLAATLQLARVLSAAGVLMVSRRWFVILGLGAALALLLLGLLAFTFSRAGGLLRSRAAGLLESLQRFSSWNLLPFILLCAVYAYLVLGRWAVYLDDDLLRWLVYLLVGLTGVVFLLAARPATAWWQAIGASLLFLATAYRIALYSQDLSTSIFSLNWSETSRYYYASLFFSPRIYGFSIPPTVLHPSRYLMQALPFLIPGTPLWLHRLWQVILWVGVTALTCRLLLRRLPVSNRMHAWMLAAWSFLFILLGPVYYHLQVPLIVVLWGFDHRRPWRTLAVVSLASLWAGISRVNWFPVPGMLAAALYFLEEPAAGRPLWRYLLLPAAWTLLGTALAFGAQAGYAVLSGNPAEQFTTSFSSDLLWYRLFPNPTYPAGVIPFLLLVCAAPLAAVVIHMTGRWRQVHWLRWLGLAGILLVLLAGGLVVSTKIGGGSNLHNLDAFLSLLLVVGLYLLADRWQPEPETPGPAPAPTRREGLLRAALAASLLMAVIVSVPQGGSPRPVDREGVAAAFQRLERAVRETAAEGGEILFISERQLLTFNILKGVRLVPEYEKVFLMEMAMADNPEYLGQFWDDLKKHRFDLIVVEPLFIRYKGPAESFGEENDAWVRNVAEKVMCDYEADRILREISLQLLVPRSKMGRCP